MIRINDELCQLLFLFPVIKMILVLRNWALHLHPYPQHLIFIPPQYYDSGKHGSHHFFIVTNFLILLLVNYSHSSFHHCHWLTDSFNILVYHCVIIADLGAISIALFCDGFSCSLSICRRSCKTQNFRLLMIDLPFQLLCALRRKA